MHYSNLFLNDKSGYLCFLMLKKIHKIDFVFRSVSSKIQFLNKICKDIYNLIETEENKWLDFIFI